MAETDPAEKALADYVAARLERIGPQFAEPEIVHEALTLHRDLWPSLFEIDHGDAAVYFARPS